MAEIDTPGVVEAFLDEQLRKAAGAMRQAVIETEFAQSQDEVPFEFGNLQATGVVSDVVIDESGASFAVGYGGGDEPKNIDIIAIVQHERGDYYHPTGRKWKYLEDPVNEHAGTLLQRTSALI